MILGKFTCNICGAENDSGADTEERERATCTGCSSSARFRAVILSLSRALFGSDLALCQFPQLKSIRGLGVSDSDIYSDRLAGCFSYTNTFYHQEPDFDLSCPDVTEFGRYDFVICSDVLEHVPPPVERSFDTLSRLLNPTGVLILTVPYATQSATIERFPQSSEYGIADINGRPVLVNRSPDGSYQVFDDLSFHGGTGATLERRVFSQADLRAHLKAAGLDEVRFMTEGNPAFGVVLNGECSLPIVAARQPFALRTSAIREMVGQLTTAREVINAAKRSRWVRVGRLLGVGPRIS